MFYVYILQSKVDQSFYIGFTTDLDRRLSEHNAGKSRYTSKKRPWEMVYTESYSSKVEALKREKFLKSQKNSSFYKRLIQGAGR